jgi:predicted enzyme related to lactoylglutathione lyase
MVEIMEVVLRVDDIERTIAFYRDVLGFDFQADEHEGKAREPVHYNACGDAWAPAAFFLLTLFPAEGSATRSEIGFGVASVDEVWDRASAYDGAQLMPPRDAGYIPRHAAIVDPAGNRVNLYQGSPDG